jgi:hypothetical protein
MSGTKAAAIARRRRGRRERRLRHRHHAAEVKTVEAERLSDQVGDLERRLASSTGEADAVRCSSQ